jgi:hypothetical protein
MRSTSLTASGMSQSGMSINGMNRPGALAHHSSTNQSFHALTQSRVSVLSFPS